jgi:hypothetical protein
MPLIKYSQYLTYPDGSPAAEASFPVQLTGGNVLVPTFTSKAGTTPLANPVLTDGDGLLTFYAAPGSFFTDIAGTLFRYFVDQAEADDAWPGLYVHEQTASASVWTVHHHFGTAPAVTVLSGAGQEIPASVAHPDAETTTLTFETPTTGTAHLRR